MKRLFIFSSTILLVTAFACKHEAPIANGTGLDTVLTGGTQPCSTDTVYFKQQILPLLTGNCTSAGCHDAGTRANNVQLTDYSSIINTTRVVAGNPTSGKLYKALTATSPSDVMPPPPRSPLSAAQIALVKKWIEQGAKNNTCNNVCDTTNIKYSTTVEPILIAYCRSCHNGSNPNTNVKYTDYTTTVATARNNRLLGAITHATGYEPMPQAPLPKLSNCDIDKIRIWIRMGYPNN